MVKLRSILFTFGNKTNVPAISLFIEHREGGADSRHLPSKAHGTPEKDDLSGALDSKQGQHDLHLLPYRVALAFYIVIQVLSALQKVSRGHIRNGIV